MRVLSMKLCACSIKNFAFLLICMFSCFSNAAFVLNGTRFIYPEGEDGLAVQVDNNSKSDYAGQAWIENKDGGEKVSFVSLPSFFEIKSEESQLLRIIKLTDQLPQDRESLFWLNVQEIPKVDKSTANKMIVAINTRVKLLYRPKDLLESRKNAEKKILYYLNRDDGHLYLKNPTGYYFAIQSIKHLDSEFSSSLESGIFAPFSEIKLPKLNKIPSYLIVDSIDDYGAVNSFVVNEDVRN
ncbi:fimbria/pilus periplasmic chaperone [Vibrio parahaemolyticus]